MKTIILNPYDRIILKKSLRCKDCENRMFYWVIPYLLYLSEEAVFLVLKFWVTIPCTPCSRMQINLIYIIAKRKKQDITQKKTIIANTGFYEEIGIWLVLDFSFGCICKLMGSYNGALALLYQCSIVWRLCK